MQNESYFFFSLLGIKFLFSHTHIFAKAEVYIALICFHFKMFKNMLDLKKQTNFKSQECLQSLSINPLGYRRASASQQPSPKG